MANDNNAASSNEDVGGSTESKVELKRQVGIIGGMNLIISTIIGSGIFISPKGVFYNAGSIGLGLIIWLGCGFFSAFGALSYAELGTMIPQSGGEYPILLEAFGPIPAYLFAWTATIITKPASLSLLSITFARYVLAPIYDSTGGCELPELPVKFVAAVLILTIIAINCYSVKWASNLITFFGFGKIISLSIIVVAGIVRLGQGYTQNLENIFQAESTPGLKEITRAFYQGLWAVDGWNQLNYIIEELKNPEKNLPKAIIISISITTTLYVTTNIAYFTAMTFDEVLVSPAVAIDFGNTVLGVMSWIIPVSVASSVVGTCLAVCFTGGRISHVAAKEGHFSTVLAMIHVKRFTPVPSVILNGSMAILMLIPSDFDTLIQYYGFATVSYYLATCIALLWFRYKKPNQPRPVKMLLDKLANWWCCCFGREINLAQTSAKENLLELVCHHAVIFFLLQSVMFRHRIAKVPIIIPIIFVILASCLVVFPIVDNPEIQYLFAILSILFGLVFYFPFVHYKLKSKIIRKLSVFLQKILMIAYPDPEDGKNHEE